MVEETKIQILNNLIDMLNIMNEARFCLYHKQNNSKPNIKYNRLVGIYTLNKILNKYNAKSLSTLSKKQLENERTLIYQNTIKGIHPPSIKKSQQKKKEINGKQ